MWLFYYIICYVISSILNNISSFMSFQLCGSILIIKCINCIFSGSLITDPRPSGYIQVSSKNTVKQLLMMRRQVSKQEFHSTSTVHERDKT